MLQPSQLVFYYKEILDTIEIEQDPVRPSWVQKPLHVPCFLFEEKKFYSPRPSTSSKEQTQEVNN